MEQIQTDSTYSTDKLNQVLEEIWQNNQMVTEYLEGSELRSEQTILDCVPALTSLSEEFSSALRQKLNYAADTLLTTHQLLNALQEKRHVPHPVPLDYLAKVSELLGDAATQLGLTEKRLHAISCALEETLTQAEADLSSQDCTNDKLAEKEDAETAKTPLPENQPHDGGHATTNGKPDGSTAKQPPSEKESTDKTKTVQKDSNITLNGVSTSPADQAASKGLAVHTECGKNTPAESQPVPQKDTGLAKQSTDLSQNVPQQASNGISSTDEVDRKAAPRGVSNIAAVSLPRDMPKAPRNHISTKQFLIHEDAEDGDNVAKVVCYITASSSSLQGVTCRLVNDMSSLVVSDSEELVSNVISIDRLDPAMKISYPVSIAIPFSARYRGSYRDIMVKVYEDKFHSSYITPISLEGNHGNQKGSFAEVKVYKFGIFSVVSCLKKETFTVPRKGLPLKPSMDSRISFNYPPGSFSSSVIVQLKVQPIDASLIASLKVKHDVFHSLVSTSPLIYIHHPSSQPFLKPVTTFLPCPPNPEKKRHVEDAEQRRAASANNPQASAPQEGRAASASMRKHNDHITEHLKLLGFRSREEQWIVLEDTAVKNVQNGLVSFELNEHLDSFIVLRLSSAMDSGHLIEFIQMLEEATQSTTVNMVLYRKKENVHKAVVEVVPTKELNLEILSLREEGYSGPPEPSEKIALREGEQIIFNFKGNICASGKGDEIGKLYKLTFHSQRKQRLELTLNVVDEFGNYCSPHYKGTAVFYKLNKEEIEKNYSHPTAPEYYEQNLTPICKLPLTLPKYEKVISRPPSTKRISTDSTDILWDQLVYWLSDELTEEDAAALVLSLPVRRSTIQLIKLKSPDNLTDQIYELLNFWKKHLPTSADKMRLLCRHLCKSGRSDLSDELKSLWESKVVPRQAQIRFAAN